MVVFTVLYFIYLIISISKYTNTQKCISVEILAHLSADIVIVIYIVRLCLCSCINAWNWHFSNDWNVGMATQQRSYKHANPFRNMGKH